MYTALTQFVYMCVCREHTVYSDMHWQSTMLFFPCSCFCFRPIICFQVRDFCAELINNIKRLMFTLSFFPSLRSFPIQLGRSVVFFIPFYPSFALFRCVCSEIIFYVADSPKRKRHKTVCEIFHCCRRLFI